MCSTALPLGSRVIENVIDSAAEGCVLNPGVLIDDAVGRRRLGRDPERADVAERVDRVAPLPQRRRDQLGGHIADPGADARGHVARLLFGQRIDAGGAAAATAQGRERFQLRQRRLRIHHAMVDRAAAVAVHLQNRRHLKAAGHRQRRERNEDGAEGRARLRRRKGHAAKMTQIPVRASGNLDAVRGRERQRPRLPTPACDVVAITDDR